MTEEGEGLDPDAFSLDEIMEAREKEAERIRSTVFESESEKQKRLWIEQNRRDLG